MSSPQQTATCSSDGRALVVKDLNLIRISNCIFILKHMALYVLHPHRHWNNPHYNKKHKPNSSFLSVLWRSSDIILKLNQIYVIRINKVNVMQLDTSTCIVCKFITFTHNWTILSFQHLWFSGNILNKIKLDIWIKFWNRWIFVVESGSDSLWCCC